MTGRTTKLTFQGDDAKAVNTQENLRYTIEAHKVNCSNIWAEFIAEPENMDANAWGTWALMNFDIDSTELGTPAIDGAFFNNREYNAMIIACGLWAGSNQSPAKVQIHPKTTRNIINQGRLELIVRNLGVSAGNVRLALMMQCNVTTL